MEEKLKKRKLPLDDIKTDELIDDRSKGPENPFADPELCPTGAASTINTARYGCSRDAGTQWHSGIDLAAAVGTELKAIYSGKILNIPSSIRDLKPTDPNYKKDLGNYIIVKSDGFSIKYCHLSQIDVALGDTIELGQVLGKTGKSGNAFDVPNKHLHLEVSTDHFGSNNYKVDPEPYLKTKYKKNGTVGTPSENPNNSDPSKCP